MVKLTKEQREAKKKAQSRLFEEPKTIEKPIEQLEKELEEETNNLPNPSSNSSTNILGSVLPSHLLSHLTNFKPQESVDANSQYKGGLEAKVTEAPIQIIGEIARLRASRLQQNVNLKINNTEIKNETKNEVKNINIQNNFTFNQTNLKNIEVKNIFTQINSFISSNTEKVSCKFCKEKINNNNLALILKDFFVCSKPTCLFEAFGILDDEIRNVKEEDLILFN